MQLFVKDKRALKPVALGVRMIEVIKDMYPDQFEFTKPSIEGARWHVDLASGNTDLRESGLGAEQLMEKWNAQAIRFQKENSKYYLYD